jgi:hypothetical protein
MVTLMQTVPPQGFLLFADIMAQSCHNASDTFLVDADQANGASREYPALNLLNNSRRFGSVFHRSQARNSVQLTREL